MEKSTIFFSHSSLDKDVVLLIKDKIYDITKGTIDIFMSSDGQSIPFGTNWIHKIEEGLNTSQIMFVFVTENSLSSGWIYFEAGYAYNKGISVVPVGLGVDIGSLKPPLNLLQGFNITSSEGLNNFVTILNREFKTTFDDLFDLNDFEKVLHLLNIENNKYKAIGDYIDRVVFHIEGRDEINNELVPVDLYSIFQSILLYLNNNDISYASEIKEDLKRLLFQGIEVSYYGGEQKPDFGYITISLSSYNFLDSFSLFTKLFREIEGFDSCSLGFYISSNYDCMKTNEDQSSIIEYSGEFVSSESRYGWYSYKGEAYLFQVIRSVHNLKGGGTRNLNHVSIISPMEDAAAYDIIDLLDKLINIGIIFKLENNEALIP